MEHRLRPGEEMGQKRGCCAAGSQTDPGQRPRQQQPTDGVLGHERWLGQWGWGEGGDLIMGQEQLKIASLAGLVVPLQGCRGQRLREVWGQEGQPRVPELEVHPWLPPQKVLIKWSLDAFRALL